MIFQVSWMVPNRAQKSSYLQLQVKTLVKLVLNSSYGTKKNQFVLDWMKSTISEKVLSTVYGIRVARLSWLALANRFASPSTSNVNQLQRQLQGLQEGGKSCSEFVESAKYLADQLSAVGKPDMEEDLISHILGGLNTAYTPFISNCYFAQHEKFLSLTDFQSEVFAFEALLETQHRSVQVDHNTFAMVANKSSEGKNGKRNKRNWQPSQCIKPTSDPPQKSGHTGSNVVPNNFVRVPAWANDPSYDPYACQICGKKNHMALDCFHRYDNNYQGATSTPTIGNNGCTFQLLSWRQYLVC